MQLTVSGRHLDIGENLKSHVEGALEEIANKYFSNITDASVVFEKQGHIFKAEIHMNLGSGLLLKGSSEAEEPYPAFDEAAFRLAKRLRRYKSKLKHHHGKTDMATAANIIATSATIPANDTEDEIGLDDQPVIVAEMQTVIEHLTVSDAVMRLELGDLPALMFVNKANGQMNMIYRRKDGNIGWVDPREAKKQA